MNTPMSLSNIPDDYIIKRGRTFVAEWYFTELGEMPAFDYYKQLSESEQDRFDYMIGFFCDRPYGNHLAEKLYRLEDSKNKIYVLKPHAQRFFNFTTNNGRIIITNGYQKQSQKLTKVAKEKLKIAAIYRMDYLRRTAEGTYYG